MTATSLDLSAIKSDVLSAAASFRSLIGLGTLATQSATITDYLTTAAAASTYQPLDSDLTSIAALSTTSFGRGLLTESSATTARTTLGLGSSATLNAGSANGVATLGADSKLTAAQIPDISLISYLGSVASQAAMLALTGQQGDWCVRSDLSTTWVITGSDPTQIGSWTQLSYPSVPVQSVFGRTGAVVGVSTDYSSVGITNTAIGATNPSTGAFTTLSANSATLSAGTLNGTVLDISQTWGGTGTYTGLKYNVTDSGPANAASLLMDLQVGGSSKFKVNKSGAITGQSIQTTSTQTLVALGSVLPNQDPGIAFIGKTNSGIGANSQNLAFYESGKVAFNLTDTLKEFRVPADYVFAFSASTLNNASSDAAIARDASDILAQRRSANAQTFRIYKTYTDATNNFERGKIGWSGDVFQIGTEKGLTSGSARALELQTDGTTRLTIDTAGDATFANAIRFSSNNAVLQNASSNRIYIQNSSTVHGIIAPASTSLFQLRGGYFLGWSDTGFSINVDTAIGRNAAGVLEINNGTGGTYRDLICRAATFSGNVTVSAVNLVTDTTTGTKIGTGTTQKLGFYNATPVVQPAAVADATDAASVITQLNLLLARMRDLGLIAT